MIMRSDTAAQSGLNGDLTEPDAGRKITSIDTTGSPSLDLDHGFSMVPR